MNLRLEMIAGLRNAFGVTKVPRLARVVLPAWQADPHKDAEFGLVVLDDGSAGFFYVWLGDTQEQIQRQQPMAGLIGLPALELADLYLEDDPARRALGLGLVNALSQCHFRRSGRALDTSRDSIAELQVEQGDHFGMVGYFPPLIRRLRARQVKLTVIEKKPELVAREAGFVVTLDPAELRHCNKVLCTGTTLLNDTVDDILSHCAAAERVAIIGPTASCLPEPLFARGCDSVGGARVMDLEGLSDRLARGERWGPTVEKYVVCRD